MTLPSESVPVAALRHDPAAVFQRLRDIHQPVVITDDGRAAAIMLSVDAYEQAERERGMLRLLVRGRREIAAGLGHDLDDVLAEADCLLRDTAG
jgi:PHD/YefM family antitoxin component YafN of YafNO toxin-antitoxin module